MYKIDESSFKEKYILYVPSMMDSLFPLLKYSLYSKNYHPIFIEEEENLINTGLKYVHPDMCFPSVLIMGQFVKTLKNCPFDLNRVKLLMPSAGDACRGSNYVTALRRTVGMLGLSDTVKVMTLNMVGIDPDNQLVIEPFMLWRAFFSFFYGDILMLLVNQVRPYEKNKGEADALWKKWIDIIADDLKQGKHMTFGHMFKNFEKICQDFKNIETTGEKKQRIGLVGELYVKYCHLGNKDMVRFLEEQGCEAHVNGATWYMCYYIDSHLSAEFGIHNQLPVKIALNFMMYFQNKMIKAMRKYGFYTLNGYKEFKRETEKHIPTGFIVGDGWLIGAETTAHIFHGCRKVLAMQPFGCLPNHTCGRGLYPVLSRKFPDSRIVSVDFDASMPAVAAYNRALMLIQSD
ncbi:MAG: hypothetical protein J6X45_04305 [Lachnospiraceae bacterium]|nr:hypothetical protein [Lachnospiraceae bacterium]